MKTLSLIRLALLIFILCWVGYNQSLEKENFDVETAFSSTQTLPVKKLSDGVRKLSLLSQQTVEKSQKTKFRDY